MAAFEQGNQPQREEGTTGDEPLPMLPVSEKGCNEYPSHAAGARSPEQTPLRTANSCQQDFQRHQREDAGHYKRPLLLAIASVADGKDRSSHAQHEAPHCPRINGERIQIGQQ